MYILHYGGGKTMILNIYKNSIKYSLEDSKTLLYFSLTIFSNFIVWMAYLIGFFSFKKHRIKNY